MTENGWNEDSITINGREINVRIGSLPQAELQFYTENPRIYSITHADGEEPSQEEIERRLCDMEHVRELVQSIRANGGLIDPLLVRDGDFVVLEGNSRLAAYRLLASNNSILWGLVKVRLLPADLDDELTFALLGEYHIIGRKDWAPYEQAGYLYRRVESHGVSAASISRQVGLTTYRVDQLVEIYRFMVDNGDNNVDRWSYYEHYLKPKRNRAARQQFSDLDEIVVTKIKSGEIPMAVDVRDRLSKIIKAGPKSINILRSGEHTFERAYVSALDRGTDNMWLNRFRTFRTHIVDEAAVDDLQVMPDAQLKRCMFELKKIDARVKYLIRKLA